MNARRQRFVQEYLVDLNATQAAKRAGYSAKTAYSQGQRLLKFVEVREAIAQAQGKAAEKVEIDQAWLRDKLRGVMESDEASPRDVISAASTMAKLLGLNEPDKSHVEVSGPPDEVIARAKKALAAIEAKRGVEGT